VTHNEKYSEFDTKRYSELWILSLDVIMTWLSMNLFFHGFQITIFISFILRSVGRFHISKGNHKEQLKNQNTATYSMNI